MLITAAGMARLDVMINVAAVVSLLVCTAVPMLVLFAICFASRARLLTHNWLTLEGDEELHTLYHSDREHMPLLCETYVGRLHDSKYTTWRGRRHPVEEREHVFLGIDLKYNYPVLLDPRVVREHAHITRGTGKTSIALTQLAVQLIGRPNTSVVILDLKVEHLFFQAVRHAVHEANIGRRKRRPRPVQFRWFTNFPKRSSYVISPFTQSLMTNITHSQRSRRFLADSACTTARATDRPGSAPRTATCCRQHSTRNPISTRSRSFINRRDRPVTACQAHHARS